VIYHDEYSDSIKEYLLSGLNKSIVVIDPFIINLNFRVVALFLKNIFMLKRNIPYKRFIFMVYQYSTIELFKPSVVITFVDNSIIFQWMSCNYTNANFYAIQNGSRSKYELYYHYYHDFKHNLTNFFCFGEYETEKYREYGHSVNNFIPVGSFRHAIYRKNNPLNNDAIMYDIALISQHKLTTFDGSNKRLKENLELIDQYLSNFLRENKNISLIILCRSEEDSEQGKKEKQYFSSIYGDKVICRFKNDVYESTYKGIDQSDLIVCCNSTALLEAVGMGKKVLFCDYSGDRIWADYPSGIWLHTEKDSVSFSRHIQNAINAKESDYIEFSSYVMKNGITIDKIKTELYKNFLN